MKNNDEIRITSAIMIPVINESDGLHVIFTRRSSRLRNHPGEISFPGGRIEPGETDLLAAKRETYEEIGLKTRYIVDSLEPVMTLVSDHLIKPFIGMMENRPIVFNEEVAAVYFPLLKTVIAKKPEIKRYPHGKLFISNPVWDFKTYTVWGATGRILYNFKNWFKNNGKRALISCYNYNGT